MRVVLALLTLSLVAIASYADLAITAKLNLDLGFIAASGSFARGNENNSHRPDGTYFLGPGATSAYGVVTWRHGMRSGSVGC